MKKLRMLLLVLLFVALIWLVSCVGSSEPGNPMKRKVDTAPIKSASTAAIDTRGIAAVDSGDVKLIEEFHDGSLFTEEERRVLLEEFKKALEALRKVQEQEENYYHDYNKPI